MSRHQTLHPHPNPYQHPHPQPRPGPRSTQEVDVTGTLAITGGTLTVSGKLLIQIPEQPEQPEPPEPPDGGGGEENFLPPDIVDNHDFAGAMGAWNQAGWSGFTGYGYDPFPAAWQDSTVDMGDGVMTSVKVEWKSWAMTTPFAAGATSIPIEPSTTALSASVPGGAAIHYISSTGAPTSTTLTSDVRVNDTVMRVAPTPAAAAPGSGVLNWRSPPFACHIDQRSAGGPGNDVGFDDLYVRYYFVGAVPILGGGGQKVIRWQGPGYGQLLGTQVTNQDNAGNLNWGFDLQNNSGPNFVFPGSSWDNRPHCYEYHINANLDATPWVEWWLDGVQVTGSGSNADGAWTNAGTRWTCATRVQTQRLAKITNYWTWNVTATNSGQVNISRFSVSQTRIGP